MLQPKPRSRGSMRKSTTGYIENLQNLVLPLNIAWTERVANIDVTENMQKEYEIIENIRKRKLLYLAHALQLIKQKNIGEQKILVDIRCRG